MDQSSSVFPQILIALVVAAAVFFIYMVFESMYRAYLQYGKTRIAVYPYTGSSSKTKIIQQNPTNPKSITLPLSENQFTGIEFSYSTFLYIADDTDSNQEGWKCVFYKGYEASPFPLCGPGVFVSSKQTSNGSPTLRVVMNTYDKWFNTVDVKQIPFNKWIHLVITLRRNTMEVYVNGNLANKKTFSGTLPYQNYQPLVLFPNATTSNNTTTGFNNTEGTTSLRGIPPGENFILNGKFSGYLSNMYYFSYAMTYSEIQAMLNMGPSSNFDSGDMDKPPYLIDSWWASRKE